MIDQHHQETMQNNSGVTLKYLQSNAISSQLQGGGGGASLDGYEANSEINALARSGAGKHFNTFGGNYFASPYWSYQGPMYQQNACMLSTFLPEFQGLQLNQINGFDTQMFSMNNNYLPPFENQFQYAPLEPFYQGYQYELQFQEFQYFVVIDFEATCDKEKNPHPQEIIEFPSVLVNSMTGQLEACFQTYVRPAYHQHLSDFCKELTGIQQIQVDRGVPLSEALSMHDKWLDDKGIKKTNFAVVTWSNWDCRVMLESECRFKKIKKPSYFNRWINLRVPFNEVFGGVRCNLKEAVQLAGLAWEGRAHCGLDDATNTARLLSYLMHRGFRFSITNSLTCHSADQSVSLQQSTERPLTSTRHPYQLNHQLVSSAQTLPTVVNSGKELQSSVLAGLKIAKPLSASQIQSKTERSTVVVTGRPREVANVLTSNGFLEPAKAGNPC